MLQYVDIARGIPSEMILLTTLVFNHAEYEKRTFSKALDFC